ncbi:MAG: DHCW motif cupin fold protein, partial [Pirellula sp.]
MNIHGIPFGVTDWSTVPKTEHPGETGIATWKTCQFGPIRVRMVEYTPNYLADHWC